MDLVCTRTHVLWFEQKSVTNLFVSSVNYHIYSCENNQYIVKVATGLRGFRPSPTQTKLYSHKGWLKA